MKKIRVGGVPEHFNLPWHLSKESGKFHEEDLDVSWRDFPDGTGAMCQALRQGEIDVSVILTEGITRDIIAGNPSRIVQEYISSPLLWGIHVAAESGYEVLDDLKGAKVAISRYGSGSHLMAYVNAKRLGWDPDELEFEIVTDINGAVKALQTGRAGYFMWEHFTTKPLVDRGIFRRIDDCPTPWPCFVIAVREEFLQENHEKIKRMLQILNNQSRGFKNIPNIEKKLAERYDQKEEDIIKWLEITEWSDSQISDKELTQVQDQLHELGLIPGKLSNSRLIYDF